MKSVFNLYNENNDNFFTEKLDSQLNLFFTSTKNFISNCNIYQLLYLLGNFTFVISLLSALLIYFPFILGLITLNVVLLWIYKNQQILIQNLEYLKTWMTLSRLIKIIFPLIIIIIGKYLWLNYYPIHSEIKYIVKSTNSFGWLNFISLIGMCSFSTGFLIEISYLWDKRSKIVDKAIYALGVISSFPSLYLARCIIVFSTSLEPVTFSRALIIFTFFFEVVCWLILTTLLLYSIYALTVFSQMISHIIKSILQRKKDKNWIESLLFKGGRGMGAGLIAFFALFILVFTAHTYIINPNFFNHIAENIIIHADYRAKANFSECTNLENEEWGLLVGNKKVSIAKPRKSGGYAFTTQLCLFEQ